MHSNWVELMWMRVNSLEFRLKFLVENFSLMSYDSRETQSRKIFDVAEFKYHLKIRKFLMADPISQTLWLILNFVTICLVIILSSIEFHLYFVELT